MPPENKKPKSMLIEPEKIIFWLNQVYESISDDWEPYKWIISSLIIIFYADLITKGKMGFANKLHKTLFDFLENNPEIREIRNDPRTYFRSIKDMDLN